MFNQYLYSSPNSARHLGRASRKTERSKSGASRYARVSASASMRHGPKAFWDSNTVAFNGQ